MKTNSKPWVENQVMPVIQRRNKLCKKFKHFGVETNKDNFKDIKMHLQKIILKKKKSYLEENLATNRKKPKKLWKPSKSLVLSLDKGRKLKTNLKKGGTTQFEAVVTRIFSEAWLWISWRPPKKIAQGTSKFTGQITKNCYAKTSCNVFHHFELSNILAEVIIKILLMFDTRKSTGTDQILEDLAFLLRNIINLSLNYQPSQKTVKLLS